MKNGKIILGIVAFIVTASGALAFRTSHKFSGATVYGATNTHRTTCARSTCHGAGVAFGGICHSIVSGAALFTDGSGHYWTATTPAHKCTHPTLTWTHDF